MYVCACVSRWMTRALHSMTEFGNQQTYNELSLSNWLLANILEAHFLLLTWSIRACIVSPTFLQLKTLYNAEQNSSALNKKLQ